VEVGVSRVLTSKASRMMKMIATINQDLSVELEEQETCHVSPH